MINNFDPFRLFITSTFLVICAFMTSYPLFADKNDVTVNEVVVVEINGTINPSTLDYINTGLHEAQMSNSQALIILLDTPGGLLTSTKEIVKSILNSDVPVVVYVYPKGASATSAGVFITLSANVAAMSPGTSIGAAHPVSIGRGTKDKKPDDKDKKDNDSVMSEKIENYASSFIESIAKERGRNAEWAEEAVRKSSSITVDEALKLKVVDLIANDLDDLLQKIDGKVVKVDNKKINLKTAKAEKRYLEMNLKQKIVNILSIPDIAFLLLSLGSLGLLVEFYNPGLIFPGVTGLISLIIGFISLQILPFNYGGLALIFIAIALFIAEIYVTSYGLMSLGGVICFILGALLLFNTQESDVGVGFDVAIASGLALGLFFFFVVFKLTKAQQLPVMGGFEGIMHKEASVVNWGDKRGKIYLHGEYWDAYSDDDINVGDKVKVVHSNGSLKLKVKKL